MKRSSLVSSLVGTAALVASGAACAVVSSSDSATAFAPRVATGSYNGAHWTAQNRIVGTGPTGGVNGGGDPIYFATAPKYNGVVSLIVTYNGVGSFICSGSLLGDRQSVLTAAHCVTNGAGLGRPDSTTAYFYGGTDPDVRVHQSAQSTPVTAASYAVNPLYTGQVIDHNDIAVIRLSAPAPAFAPSYSLYGGSDLTGAGFNIAGYGGRSSMGGALGTDSRTGYRRQGDNRYDYRLGDSDFGTFFDGFFDDPSLPAAQVGFSYLADFDSGLPRHDAAGFLASEFDLDGPKYDNLGRGITEATSAGGDSGGPQFVDGQIASITSYGLSFGKEYGDLDNDLNDTFGEFGGYVPVSIHADFINAQLIPEPGTYALMALGLVAVGSVARRRGGG